jgi:hypothetical protein
MPSNNLTTQQLQQKITSLEKGKKYAWGKYYGEVNNQLNQNTIQYNTMKEFVENIPTHIKDEYIKMLDELKKTIECPICFEVIENNNLQLSNCGHKYCKSCYDRILTETNKCAICKKKLKWN